MLVRLIKIITICLWAFAPICIEGQIAADINGATNKPDIDGGHAYINLLAETIDPSMGTVSIHLGFPVPKGRGLVLPFSLDYSTSGLSAGRFRQSGGWGIGPWWIGSSSAWDQDRQGGWSYSQPQLTYTWMQKNATDINDPDGTTGLCDFFTNFHFQGLGYNSELPVGVLASDSANNACGNSQEDLLQGGDANLYASLSQKDILDGGSINITNRDGTTFTFSSVQGHKTDSGALYTILQSVEDRNGNTYTGFASSPWQGYPITMTDTMGRQIVNVTGSGNSGTTDTVSVGNLQYSVVWNKVSSNFSLPSQVTRAPNLPGQYTCPGSSAASGSLNAVSEIDLPNGQKYRFFYGSNNPYDSSVNNPYGLINEIIYPGGGWVKYTYTVNDAGTYSNIDVFSAILTNNNKSEQACMVQYTPARVSTRTVSYDGVTVAETQTFTYSTTWPQPLSSSWPSISGWSSKSTSVTAADNVRNASYKIVYNYQIAHSPSVPYMTESISSQMPIESTVSTYDWDGSLLDTQYEGWYDSQKKACDFHAANGNVALATGHFYSYTNSILTDDKEYDSGTISNPGTVCNGVSLALSAPSASTPSRETSTSLQKFTTLSTNPFWRPQTVSSYQNGVQFAEIDYSYDSYPLVSVSTVQHDDIAYSSGVNAGRGNLSQIINKCIGQNCNGNPTTKMTYDSTGQMVSKIDPCGNGACLDMVGASHTILYQYDSNANGYLTQVKFPDNSTNSYAYDNTSGNMLSASDTNGNITKYTYDDSLNRLTQIDLPDGGVTRIKHHDSDSDFAPSSALGIKNYGIAVETSVLQSGASNWRTSVVLEDGMGHPIETQSFVSASETDYIDTAYDGLGRILKQTSPYGAVPNGTTTYAYDSLGRKIIAVFPDGKYSLWCYNNTPSSITPPNSTITNSSACSSMLGTSTANVGAITGVWTDYLDGNGNHWQYIYDGQGQLTQTIEPNGLSRLPSMETDYSYDPRGNLLSVVQWGGPHGNNNGITRTFSYDGLGRLASSSNAESGNIGYTYDLSANLSSKTDARNIATNYQYDSMNRLISKTYSLGSSGVDPTGTPISCYGFGTSTAGGNSVGRMQYAWTQPSGTACTGTAPTYTPSAGTSLTWNNFSYDVMGRISNTQQLECVGANCTAPTPSALAYTYNLDGSLSSFSSAVTGTPVVYAYQYDAVGRLGNMSSTWNDATHPATLFNATSYSAQGLLSASLGVSSTSAPTAMITRSYDIMGRISAETDTGTSVQSSSATGSVGAINLSFGEQSKQNQTQAATVSVGSVTITGSERYVTDMSNDICLKRPTSPGCKIYDAGTIVVNIGSFSVNAYYGQSSSVASIANTLTNALNGAGSPVTASVSGSTITLTSKSAGAAANYGLSAGVTTYDSSDFSSASFNAVASGASMTGGKNASSNTIYDSGTITAQVNGISTQAVAWSNGSSAQTVASSLASALSSSVGSYITATATGSSVALNSVGAGTSKNWPVSISITFDSADFSSASLSANVAGMTGGSDAGYQQKTVYSFNIPSGGFDGAGNITSVNDSVTGAWNYTYDSLNRLTLAAPSSGAYGCWQYDAFGNRTAEVWQTSGCSSVSVTAKYNAANRVTWTSVNSAANGFTYDAAGDVTNDNSYRYAYDAEGRICAVYNPLLTTFTGYVYDAQGTRVAKGSLSAITLASDGSLPLMACNIAQNGFHANSYYLLGLSGEQIAEQDGNGAWKHVNLFAGGKLLATYSSADNDTYFALTDWLGTKRAEITPDGKMATFSSLPYGNGLTQSGSGMDATEQHFTGKERDSESGNDYFGARYYSSAMGRFLSPDWSAKVDPVPYAKLDDPQTLNLYAYVRNNPITGVDATGHYVRVPMCDMNCASDIRDHQEQLQADNSSAADPQPPTPQPNPDQPLAQQQSQDAIGGDGVPSNRLTLDGSGNLVYTHELYGGAFSTCDSCLHVSDPYGAPRDNGTTQHGGIDLATGGKTGIDVLSQTNGKVIQIGASGFGPHSVTMQSPAGTYFTYGHLASNLVKVGDSIKAGTPLGEIGNLGNSTGIHVHIQASTASPWGPTSRMLGITFP